LQSLELRGIIICVLGKRDSQGEKGGVGEPQLCGGGQYFSKASQHQIIRWRVIKRGDNQGKKVYK